MDVDVGIEYKILRRLSLKIGGRYRHMSFKFNGMGELTDREPTDNIQDVTGALDRYLGGYLLTTYLF